MSRNNHLSAYSGSSRRKRRFARRGVVALDVVMTLAFLMVIALSAYKMAVISVGKLYEVISVLLGSPYL